MSTLIAYQFEACLHFFSYLFIALKYASRCWQIVLQTCFAYILLTVTPFGVFFICNLISFSCTWYLCGCFFFLTNLKCGLGQNSNKLVNHRGHLVLCHV